MLKRFADMSRSTFFLKVKTKNGICWSIINSSTFILIRIHIDLLFNLKDVQWLYSHTVQDDRISTYCLGTCKHIQFMYTYFNINPNTLRMQWCLRKPKTNKVILSFCPNIRCAGRIFYILRARENFALWGEQRQPSR